MQKLLNPLFNGVLLLMASTAVNAAPSVVELQTNLGTIAIQLDYQHAPISANNFISYVNNGFYKDTIIHRVIKGFMMQGGGVSKLDGRFKAAIAAPITNEATNGLSNLAGTVAMARTNDPNSATSQFFINFVDNKFLDYSSATSPGYAVFGQVVAGMSVVKKVENLLTYNTLNPSDNYSFPPNLPVTSSFGLVTIDAVYTSESWQPALSKTRIMIKGSGKVVSLPAGIDCGTSCELSQSAGETLKITAQPAKGFSFIGWQGDCRGLNKSIVINTSLGNHNCLATFARPAPLTQ